MLNDFKEECRGRTLQAFPERQLYLRSSGEVKYFVFSTRLQLAIVAGIAFTLAWCLITLVNVIWSFTPFYEKNRDIRALKADYEQRLDLAYENEANAQLMLTQQRKAFEQMTSNIKEKHQTLSQIYSGEVALSAGVAPDTSKYARERVLMAPIVRDAVLREARVKIDTKPQLKKAESEMGTAKLASLDLPDPKTPSSITADIGLGEIASTTDTILAAAEQETLERIERTRAVIKATEIDIQSILKANSFGKGGPYISPSSASDASTEGEFGSRISSIKARINEAEALDEAMKALPLGHPINAESYRTSNYGNRRDPFTKRPTFHEGVDMGSYRMAPIVATADGKISYVGRKGGYGRVVEIDHGHGFKTRYAHLAKTYVKRGKEVKKGDKIAGMGSTGRSTSTHLHYEIRFQGRAYDPEKFLKAGNYVQ